MLYRAADDDEGLAEALRAYGMTRMFANDSDGATASFSEALDLYRTHGNRRGEAWALQNLAWVAYTNGDAGKAEAWLNESVQAFTEIRDSGGLGWATGLLAFVWYHQGRHAEAEAMAQRMYVDAGQRGDRWAEGHDAQPARHARIVGRARRRVGTARRGGLQAVHGHARLVRRDDLRRRAGSRARSPSVGSTTGSPCSTRASRRASELTLDQAQQVAEAQMTCAAAQAGMPDRSTARAAYR